MGLFSRRKNQATIDEMEQDLIATEQQSDFEIQADAEGIAPEQVQTQAPQANQKDQQDWLNSYEGQLTIDVYQNDDSVIIKSTIAGVRPEDLDVTINGDMLTIRGSRKKDEIISEENYFYQECYWGEFARSVIMPMEVQAEKIEAELKDGILTVTLPKAQKDKTKKIMVKASK